MNPRIQFFRIGVASCGVAAGAEEVRSRLEAASSVPVIGVGCIGHCYAEPWSKRSSTTEVPSFTPM